MQQHVVDAVLFVVLGLGEAHRVLLLVAILVGEDDHEVGAREVFRQLVGQTVEGVLVADSAFTGGHHDEQVVRTYACRQLGQLVPVGHELVLTAHAAVLAVDEVADELERLLASVEQDATVQLFGKAAQTLQPAVEARLVLSPRGHGHLYQPQRGHRLFEAGEDDLAVQSVVEALYELAPELLSDVRVNVHAHHHLRAARLAEGVLDAVGYVGGQSHLRLHRHL